jgi:hypothetical protein
MSHTNTHTHTHPVRRRAATREWCCLVQTPQASSSQRRCHPEEALYLPTFSHLLIVNKLLSLSVCLSLSPLLDPPPPRFRRAAFYQGLKSKVGLAADKAAGLRINLSTVLCGVVAPPVHAPSRSPLLQG